MTTVTIQEQVNIIKRATNKASRSRKAAKAFLTAAGIITKSAAPRSTRKKSEVSIYKGGFQFRVLS